MRFTEGAKGKKETKTRKEKQNEKSTKEKSLIGRLLKKLAQRQGLNIASTRNALGARENGEST